jgi:hypothetical protein
MGGDSMKNNFREAEVFKKCINLGWSMNHRVSIRTKRTICGLKWNKQVWAPLALYFDAHKNCKRCFRGKRNED